MISISEKQATGLEHHVLKSSRVLTQTCNDLPTFQLKFSSTTSVFLCLELSKTSRSREQW